MQETLLKFIKFFQHRRTCKLLQSGWCENNHVPPNRRLGFTFQVTPEPNGACQQKGRLTQLSLSGLIHTVSCLTPPRCSRSKECSRVQHTKQRPASPICFFYATLLPRSFPPMTAHSSRNSWSQQHPWFSGSTSVSSRHFCQLWQFSLKVSPDVAPPCCMPVSSFNMVVSHLCFIIPFLIIFHLFNTQNPPRILWQSFS